MVFTKGHRIKLIIVLVLFVIGLGSGWLFVVQFKTIPPRVLNPVTPYVSLTQSQATLAKDQEEIKKKIKELRAEIKNQQEAIKIYRASSKKTIEELERYKEAVGLTEKKGRGLVITLADSTKNNPTIDSIVHAADLRDLVNVLWLSGAEAISINNERLTLNSSIDSIINTVLVNNTKINNPFVVRVMGDQNNLTEGLAQSPNLADLRERVQKYGIVYNIEKSKEVVVDEFNGSFVIKFAQISQ